jgi:AraC-like DNA-binding protein
MTLREEPVKHGFAADYIRYLIQFLEAKGYRKKDVLAAANIEESDLERGDDWIYHSINHNDFSQSLRKISGNGLLGFEFGASISLKEHGYIGYAAGNAETLGQALEMLTKYFRTRTTLFTLTIIEEGEFNIIQVDDQADLGEGLNFWVQGILGTLMRVTTEIFGDDLQQKLMEQSEARLSFERPESISEELADALEGVSFGHTISQLRIPKSLMDLPLKDPDKLVSEMAQKHCEDQLMNIAPMQQSIVSRVRRSLEAEKGVYPNLEEVAGELNMSSRSLKRKLKAADSSFQKILDNLRKTEAVEYLSHSDQTIDEISRLLGFSDPSNFGRAFKKWMGVSPRAYRSRAMENSNSASQDSADEEA